MQYLHYHVALNVLSFLLLSSHAFHQEILTSYHVPSPVQSTGLLLKRKIDKNSLPEWNLYSNQMRSKEAQYIGKM